MATLFVDSAAPELLAVSNIVRSLSNSPVQFNVRDVADATTSDDFLKHSPSKEVPVLVTPDGVAVGVINVAKAIAKHDKAGSDQWFGSTAAEQADVEKWVNHCLKELGPTVHKPQERKHLAHLSKLNKTLLPRVFLESSRLTLADLFTYATIHSVVSTFSDKDKMLFHNVVRWFDNIQHLPGVTGVLPVVPVDADLAEKVQQEEKKEEKKAPAKAQPKQKEAAPAAPAVDENVDISALDIRVGKIIACRQHTEKLYVETIDIGEDKPRNVVSGLVQFVPLEQMQGRKVLVLCNLKPAVLQKETSEGMVLAASNHDHTQVELVNPPADAKIGERVSFPGHEGAAHEAIDLKSKQPTAWTRLSPNLKTDASRVARWKDVPFTTSAGTCTVASLVDAHIA